MGDCIKRWVEIPASLKTLQLSMPSVYLKTDTIAAQSLDEEIVREFQSLRMPRIQFLQKFPVPVCYPYQWRPVYVIIKKGILTETNSIDPIITEAKAKDKV